jgi:hypothetical protein
VSLFVLCFSNVLRVICFVSLGLAQAQALEVKKSCSTYLAPLSAQAAVGCPVPVKQVTDVEGTCQSAAIIVG